jgi:alpha-soluble NSF attachment protein
MLEFALLSHIKVAFISAQLERYDRAIELYESIATSMLDSALLKWSAKEYFLKAGLCRLCSGDLVAAEVFLFIKGLTSSEPS